mgnify:CR=1 FL=1
MKRVNVTISGDVQAVFFRSFIRQNASDRGINGYVRNKGDGKVEAVFEGKDKDIDDMVKICKKGPPGAKVKSVQVKEERYLNEFLGFNVV